MKDYEGIVKDYLTNKWELHTFEDIYFVKMVSKVLDIAGYGYEEDCEYRRHDGTVTIIVDDTVIGRMLEL